MQSVNATQATLSVCVITKNEGRFLRTCLQSIQEIANQIIVVDSGSTDATLEIARSFHADISTIEWLNDYSFARNQAISKCIGEWILFLDADEYLQNPKALINRIKNVSDSRLGGFLIERTDIYRHKESGLLIHYPVGLVRLFRNNAGFKYSGAVHEQVNTSITSQGFGIEVLIGCQIIHQINEYEDAALNIKQRRYLTLIREELIKSPENDWMNYQKAKTLWFLDEKEEAKKVFAAISEQTKSELVIRCSCYCNLAILLMEEGNTGKALEVVQKSLALNPHQSMGRMVLGNILYQENRFREAIQAFRKVQTRLNKIHFNQIIPGDLYVKPEEQKYKIASCYLAMGKRLAAWYLLSSALKINPNHVTSILLLSKILQSKNKNKAIALARKCISINPEWNSAQLFLKKLTEK